MCLIIQKFAGIELPDKIIDNALLSNADGWGVMYSDGIKIRTHKGMEGSTLLDLINILPIDIEYFVHLRMATHGNINLSMCHPFRISKDLYMMHNGIISALAAPKNKKSDSALFAELLTKELPKAELIFNEEAIARINNYVGKENRIVFLHSSGRSVIINGDRGINYNGLWCSNTYAWDLWDDKRMYLEYDDGNNEFIDYGDIHKLSLKRLQQLDYDSLLALIYDYPDDVANAIKWG